MLRMIFYLILGAVAVFFASQNLEIVRLYIFTGAEIQVPLIMVIFVSFFAGFLTAVVGVIQKAFRRNKLKNNNMIVPRRSIL